MELLIFVFLIVVWVVSSQWIKKEVRKRNDLRQKFEQEEREKRQVLHEKLVNLIENIDKNVTMQLNIHDYLRVPNEN